MNDRAASLIGVPDEDIETRHDAFDVAVQALVDQAAAFEPELGRKAYQLLLEMHALGACMPEHMQLPSLTWELRSPTCSLAVSVMIMANQWDFLLNGARAVGRNICEEGHLRGTPREFASYVMRIFERDAETQAALDDLVRAEAGAADAAGDEDC